MRGAIPPLPHMSSCRGAWLSTGYVFMAWCFVKNRNIFTFYLILPYFTYAKLYNILPVEERGMG
jgi:hypothetical protein